MFELSGKTALVTGSSQGIGKEIAKVLAKHGANVFAHGSHPSDKLNEAAKYIGTDKIVTGNLCDADIADKLFEQTGGVDILILNASIQYKRDWNEFSAEEYDVQFNCNVRSTYFIIKKYMPYMQDKKWGRVITIGSVNQYNNHQQLLIYGVTKAAQYKMIEGIAKAVAKDGITVNNIAPGAISTPRNAAVSADEKQLGKVLRQIPVGYMGSADDMNGIILLLCSGEGRYITGSEIIADGGMRL